MEVGTDPQARADVEVLKQLAQKHELQNGEDHEERIKKLEEYRRRLEQIIECRV